MKIETPTPEIADLLFTSTSLQLVQIPILPCVPAILSNSASKAPNTGINMTTKPNSSTTLLSRAHSPSTANQIYTERIKTKPLLLRPSSPDPTTNVRSLRRKARQQKESLARRGRKKNRKPQPLCAAQKRKLCLYDIPTSQRKYAIYEPLHEMWCGYIREILSLSGGSGGGARKEHVSAASAGPMLTGADFHGAMIEVVRSRCVGRVGLKGIVVKDTKFTFEIVTKGNEIKSEYRACS